jgi:hypothetical protein
MNYPYPVETIITQAARDSPPPVQSHYLTVTVAQYDIDATNDADKVGDHMPLGHDRKRGDVHKGGRLKVNATRFIAACSV